MRAAAVVVILTACGAAPKLSDLERDVFTPSCAYAGCHAAAGPANGLDLQTKGAWKRLVGAKASVAGKTLVVAGRPGDSYLLERLKGNMPPADPLAPKDLDDVRDWIAAGAHDD